jgi:PAS domain S-box-containing protein
MLPLSDTLVAAIVSLAADAIICVDAEQRITFFNEGAARVFGYEPEEMLGQQLSKLLPARFRDAHASHIESFGTSTVAARKMGDRSLISGVRKNGEEFPAEAAIAHMQSERGPVFSVVLRDVTEQRRAQELNERLLVQMEKAVNQRDEMLALVSHDLRNPANAVKMLAGAIVRAGAELESTLPTEIVGHAAVMLQAAMQMDSLIQDLLDSTRLEAGRLRLSPVRTSVIELISAALETLTPFALEKSIALSAHLAPGLPDVFADPARVTQVLSNLIGNAIKFTPERGRVSVEGSLEGTFVQLAVRDSGVGIARDDLPFVFDRFWQSKRMNRSGAGLGLAIARGIVLGHGGRIWIESRQGVETIVHLTLPTREFPEDAYSPVSGA